MVPGTRGRAGVWRRPLATAAAALVLTVVLPALTCGLLAFLFRDALRGDVGFSVRTPRWWLDGLFVTWLPVVAAVVILVVVAAVVVSRRRRPGETAER